MSDNVPYASIKECSAEDWARAVRNGLLLESDKYMIEDNPCDKEIWKAYRQSLRDWPKSKGFPDLSTLPEVPLQN